MTPQQAAAVWVQVPDVEQALTPRVAGLANVLTGLAIISAALPSLVVAFDARDGALGLGDWWWLHVPVAVLLVLLFLGLRRGVWNIYAASRHTRPGTVLHEVTRSRMVQIAYLAVVLWWLVVLFSGLQSVGSDETVSPRADNAFTRSGDLLTGLLVVYTISIGWWESRQPWSPRPYLLATGVLAVTAAIGLLLAVGTIGDDLAMLTLGLGWMLAGAFLYHQA